MPDWEDLSGDISDLKPWHSGVNAAIVGAYMRLVADGYADLANAWLGCSVEIDQGNEPLREGRGPYTKNPRATMVLTVRANSQIQHQLLESNIDLLRGAVSEFSAGESVAAVVEPPIWVELGNQITPSTETLVAEITATVESSNDASVINAWNGLSSAIERGCLGWSQVSGQRVSHLLVDEIGSEGIDQVVSELDLIASLKNQPLNNWSHVSVLPGSELLSKAAERVGSPSKAKLRVGLVIPGGPAAPSDVKKDLENHPFIELHEVVVPRGAIDIGNRMAEAVSNLSAQNDVLIVAYGGGKPEDLQKVFDALRSPLEHVQLRTWVAIGHASDKFNIDNPKVVMCRTPSDARSLFLAEALEYPRSLLRLARNLEDALMRSIDPVSVNRAERDFKQDLSEAQGVLKDRRAEHGQGA